MRTALFIITMLLLCGCQIAKKAEPVPKVVTKRQMAVMDMEVANPGPVGIVNPDYGVVLVLSGTNQNPCIVFKDRLVPNQPSVGRYIHDRNVYGDSLWMDGGHLAAPLDRPTSYFMFSRAVSETNQYVIEHWKDLNP